MGLHNAAGEPIPARPKFDVNLVSRAFNAAQNFRPYHTTLILRDMYTFVTDLRKVYRDVEMKERDVVAGMVELGWEENVDFIADISLIMYCTRMAYIHVQEEWVEQYKPVSPHSVGEVIQQGLILYVDLIHPAHYRVKRGEDNGSFLVKFEDAVGLSLELQC